MVLFLVVARVSSTSGDAQGLVFAGIVPFSLLFAPSLFNPGCFSIRNACDDLSGFLRWLGRDDVDGWLSHHRSLVKKKALSSLASVLLPSKELIVSIFLLVLVIVRMTEPPINWTVGYVLLVALPLGPLAICSVVFTCWWLISRFLTSKHEQPVPIVYHFCAALILAELVVEAVGLHDKLFCKFDDHLANHSTTIPHSMARTFMFAVIACRYFCWRVGINYAAYIIAPSEGHAQIAKVLRAPISFGLHVLRLTAGSLMLLMDASLGILIQCPILFLAFVPTIKKLHFLCLFHASESAVLGAKNNAYEAKRHRISKLRSNSTKHSQNEFPDSCCGVSSCAA